MVKQKEFFFYDSANLVKFGNYGEWHKTVDFDVSPSSAINRYLVGFVIYFYGGINFTFIFCLKQIKELFLAV